MAAVLEMIFKNEEQKNVTISISDPVEDLTGAEVKAVMDNIIAKNVFTTSGGDIVQASGARIVSREVTELELS
ncbi:MAG: DUF2922 domain-containing protein [Clostridiaceae bacterium]|nr:DUF2922 domain-containing protein [Clostridiaceae bacterium]